MEPSHNPEMLLFFGCKGRQDKLTSSCFVFFVGRRVGDGEFTPGLNFCGRLHLLTIIRV